MSAASGRSGRLRTRLDMSLAKELKDSPPETILVIRTDRVGDLLLSTPFLQGLRAGFPSTRIVARVEPYCREVLSESGLVDEVVTTTDVRAVQAQLCVCLAPRSSALKLARQSGARWRLGYTYAGRPLVNILARWALTHRETVTISPPHIVPHEVEQLDRLARRLGLPSTLEYSLRIAPVMVERIPERVVFHLGDRWLVEGWTVDDLSRLLAGLATSYQLVVTAGPREKSIIAENAQHFEGLDLRTGLGFQDWSEVVASAACLVTPDTGAVHLAAAVGTPVIVAYEEQTYAHCSRQWSPWKVRSRSLVKESPSVTVGKLLSAVEDLLSDSRNGRLQDSSGEF